MAALCSAQVTYTDDYKLYLERVGFNQLKAELGAAMPTGAGVGVSQVEAFSGSGYAPGTVDNSTLTGTYGGHTYTLKSGATGTSGHAGSVARFLFADLSMAKGTSTLHMYDASGWRYFNHLNQAFNQAPSVETNKVSSHSYIWTSTTADPNLLRRLDYAIDRDGYTAVLGTPSGGNVRPGLGANYNGITVGRSDIDNNNYVTGVVTGGEGNGRSKPDIVAPERLASYTAPIVAGAATLMWQTVQDNSALADARNPQTIKAALMAGATKDEFMQPTTPASVFWERTHTKPLSETWGAGQVNVYRSYHILNSGRQLPDSNLASKGWDFNQTAASPKTYYFNVSPGHSLDDLSILLTWHREITPVDGNWTNLQAFLANLDLKLYTVESGELGTLIDQSISSIDNVEHIFLPDGLSSGRYALQVMSDTAGVDYGLAWYSNAVVPEPGTMGILVMAAMLILPRRRSDRGA